MQMSPGCNCCCVELVVDDDNTDKWEKDDYSTPGEVVVTILTPVDLCSFMFGFEAVGSGNAVSADGTATIYFLEDPSDADVDAIGTIEFTGNYDKDGLVNAPFWASPETDNFSHPYPFPDGTIVFDITDLGMSQTVNHAAHFAGLTIASFDDKFYLGTDYLIDGNGVPYFSSTSARGTYWLGTTTGMDLLDNLSYPCVLERTECTEKTPVYVRYRITGDYTLPDVKFSLHTLNSVGDRTCRTESEYYTADTESGTCTTPPGNCLVFPTERQLFLEIEYDWPDQGQTGSTGDFLQTFWYVKDDPVSPATSADCSAKQEQSRGLTALFWQSNDDTNSNVEHYFAGDATISCDAGTYLLTLRIDHAYWTGSVASCTWEVELDFDVLEPKDIPSTALTNADAVSTTGGGFPSDVTFTINP